MTNIRLRYHWGLDLLWTLSVNIAGEILAIYLWWRIAPLADLNYHVLFWSVFFGYIGVSLLIIVNKFQKKSAKRALLNISGGEMKATNYNGKVLNDCVARIDRTLMQRVSGTCDLHLKDRKTGEKMRIKNVSYRINDYV